MAAFSDFLDLRTAVVEQVGSERIVDVFPRLVKLAESRMNRDLRTADQISSASVVFVGGEATLPTDCQTVISLIDQSGLEFVQSSIQEVHGAQGGTYLYTVLGSTIESAGKDGAYTLYYYADIPTITDSTTDDNWLLGKYPEVYLYGVAAEAFKWLLDIEKAQITSQLYEDAVLQARAQDQRERFSRALVVNRQVTP